MGITIKSIIALLFAAVIILGIAIISRSANPLGHLSHFLSHFTLSALHLLSYSLLFLLGVAIIVAILASIATLFCRD